MKVLLLGAGASVPFDYPLANQLLPAIAALQGPVEALKAMRESSRGQLLRVLRNSNVEIVLTALDLLAEAAEEERRTWWSSLYRFEHPGTHPTRSEPRAFAMAREARLEVLRHLAKYFANRSWADKGSTFDSLDGILQGLRCGDAVITTNWDSLAERILIARGLLSLSDGLGFQRTFIDCARHQELPQVPSPVKLLKLHGSFGWNVDRQGSVYLRSRDYLRTLPYPFDSGFKDSAEPALPVDLPYLAYPTYLKRLSGPLTAVWSTAGRVLLEADRVEVIGYSLPESDASIRGLLIPLRDRLERKDVEVEVCDRSPATLERWREFLGSGVKLTTEILTSRLRLRQLGRGDPGMDAALPLLPKAHLGRNGTESLDTAHSREVDLLDAGERALRSRDGGLWGFRFPDKGVELAGYCGLIPSDTPRAPELVFGFTPEARDRGLDKEAARAVLDFSYSEFGLRTVFTGDRAEELAIYAVLKDLGYREWQRGRAGSESEARCFRHS